MTRLFRRRRELRADAIEKALHALENLPDVGPTHGDTTAAAWDLAEILEAVTAARRQTRPRSLAGLLLRDAELWANAWLDEYQAQQASVPHLAALGRTLTSHLGRVAERLSTVVELEQRHAADSDWPPRSPGRL